MPIVEKRETSQWSARMELLYRKNGGKLYCNALKITGNRERAEDALHDAFASVLKKRERYMHLTDDELARLMLVAVKNKCIDLLRADEKYVGLADNRAEAIDITELSVEEKVSDADGYERLKAYIAAADPAELQLLEMKYIAEMSYGEIAEALAVNKKAVDMRLMRAKQKLKKLLTDI